MQPAGKSGNQALAPPAAPPAASPHALAAAHDRGVLSCRVLGRLGAARCHNSSGLGTGAQHYVAALAAPLPVAGELDGHVAAVAEVMGAATAAEPSAALLAQLPPDDDS